MLVDCLSSFNSQRVVNCIWDMKTQQSILEVLVIIYCMYIRITLKNIWNGWREIENSKNKLE